MHQCFRITPTAMQNLHIDTYFITVFFLGYCTDRSASGKFCMPKCQS
jgi:hypothetical protein